MDKKGRVVVCYNKIFTAVCCCSLSFSLFAQQKVDTAYIYSVPEVIVSNRYPTNKVRSATPVQSFSNKTLKSLSALQVSDVVKHFAGVTVKDYGGIGGLKTVSIRSLGAQHTAVGYDGITLTDCQTGQIDIGRLSLDNVDRISLNNGQSDNIFQPARFFASAGVLNIQTLIPTFQEKKETNLSAKFNTGSWGLVNPSLLIEQKICNKWSLSANGEWMSSDGHYSYTLHYGNSNNEQSSQEKRKNTDIKTLRTELGLYGNISDTEQWRLKAYYFQSSRGLPNATTFYYQHSLQHLWDKNVFIQSQYKKEIGRQWALQTAAKWNWNYQHYLDPDYKGVTGKVDNSYYQQEYYLSASVLHKMLNGLSFAFSTDGSINTMNANLTKFPSPTRYSWLSVLAAKYVNNRLTLSASALSTVIREETKQGNNAGNYHKLSPYAGISFMPFRNEEFHIRFFYKSIFRLPSFNDLYYNQTGSINLKPESTQQYNLGVTYTKEICHFIPYISATIDAYYNKVNDKIVAIPTKNLFVWSMVNLGKAEIKGVNATTEICLQTSDKLRLRLNGNYTYQHALDVTDSDPNTIAGKTYKHQISYTPRISASGQASIETPWINFSYSFIFSGKRYVLGQNISENLLGSYSDHSFSAGREFKLKKIILSLNMQLLNLKNENYEIVKNFPMPGRSIRMTIGLKY